MFDLLKILDEMFTLYGALNICVIGMSMGKGLRKGILDEIRDKFNEYLNIFSNYDYQKRVITLTLIYYLMK